MPTPRRWYVGNRERPFLDTGPQIDFLTLGARTARVERASAVPAPVLSPMTRTATKARTEGTPGRVAVSPESRPWRPRRLQDCAAVRVSRTPFLAGLLALVALCAPAVGRASRPTTKKAIFGPVTRGGVLSAFPLYHRLGVGIY